MRDYDGKESPIITREGQNMELTLETQENIMLGKLVKKRQPTRLLNFERLEEIAKP